MAPRYDRRLASADAGVIVRNLRLKLRLSQTALGKRCEPRLYQSEVSAIECGRLSHPGYLKRIARVLNVPDELLLETPAPSSDCMSNKAAAPEGRL